jgi:hypothetical protein
MGAPPNMSHFWHEISRNWQAILTLIVSVAVALISWLQWRTARNQWRTATKQSETADKQWQTAEKQAETAKNKLRLELFERRIAVYDALMEMAAIAAVKGEVTPEQQRKWAIATKGAEFLFNKEIDDYCLKLGKEAVLLGLDNHHIDRLKFTRAKEHLKAEMSKGERLIWFNTQIDEMPKRFAEFLKIEG